MCKTGRLQLDLPECESLGTCCWACTAYGKTSQLLFKLGCSTTGLSGNFANRLRAACSCHLRKAACALWGRCCHSLPACLPARLSVVAHLTSAPPLPLKSAAKWSASSRSKVLLPKLLSHSMSSTSNWFVRPLPLLPALPYVLYLTRAASVLPLPMSYRTTCGDDAARMR